MHLEPKRRKQTKNIKKHLKMDAMRQGEIRYEVLQRNALKIKKDKKINFGVYTLKHIITSKNVHIHIRMYKYKLL